jgi:hypothetical protein
MNRRGVYQLELVAATTLIAAVCLVAIFAFASHGPRHSTSNFVNIKQKGDGVEAIDKIDAFPHYIGIAAGGCAAANCHGGVRSSDDSGQLKPGDEWKTSAFDFLQHDPHAQAYNVLFEERSRYMIDRLGRWDATAEGGQPAEQGVRGIKWYIEQLQNKCVSCHATPLPADASTTPRGSLNHYALGVTCEACHGPASRWGDLHLSAGWKTSSSEADGNSINKAATGFNELEMLSVAAATCAKCHIGSGEQIDQSIREVTHDLIAAGHPRLDFDFAAWYASMPAHWNREREKRKDFNTEAWSRGQTASLQTRMACAGATLNRREATAAHANPPPWPELAHFDCYACHQALRLPPNGGAQPPTQLAIPYGTAWSVYRRTNMDSANDAMNRYGELLGANRSLGLPGKQPAEQPLTPHTVATTLVGWGDISHWDELLSWYYAADAVSRDAAFAAQSSPDLQDAAKTMETSLEALKAETEKYLARDGEVSRYVSPRGFGVAKVGTDDTEKPDAQAVQIAFEKAIQALRTLADKWER